MRMIIPKNAKIISKNYYNESIGSYYSITLKEEGKKVRPIHISGGFGNSSSLNNSRRARRDHFIDCQEKGLEVDVNTISKNEVVVAVTNSLANRESDELIEVCGLVRLWPNEKSKTRFINLIEETMNLVDTANSLLDDVHGADL